MKITGLTIYPIKSCAPVEVQSIQVTPKGMLNDRRWMFVDENNKFITQRTHSQMQKIKPFLIDDKLYIKFPNFKEEITLEENSWEQTENVTVWDDELEAYVLNLEHQEQVDQFFNQKVKLVALKNEHNNRQLKLDQNKSVPTFFVDKYPLLLVTEKSLDEMSKLSGVKQEAERYRPNIVIDGSEPFAEDDWQEMSINKIQFRILGPRSRCVIPSLNLESGESQKEVLLALNKHRKTNGKTLFGMSCSAESDGVLSLGDLVTF